MAIDGNHGTVGGKECLVESINLASRDEVLKEYQVKRIGDPSPGSKPGSPAW